MIHIIFSWYFYIGFDIRFIKIYHDGGFKKKWWRFYKKI